MFEEPPSPNKKRLQQSFQTQNTVTWLLALAVYMPIAIMLALFLTVG